MPGIQSEAMSFRDMVAGAARSTSFNPGDKETKVHRLSFFCTYCTISGELQCFTYFVFGNKELLFVVYLCL